MKTTIPSIFMVSGLLLFLMSPGVMGGDTEVDPLSGDARVAKRENPNHLEPIPAYDPNGYDQAVFKSLIGEGRVEAWMIGKPSFGPEYAVLLRGKMKNDSFPVLKLGDWSVEYVEVKNQIWRWKQEGGRMELDIKVTKDVRRSQVGIEGEFASTIFKAWESVLKRTRYAGMKYRGLDGDTFQFYCRPDFFGEIWSPTNGMPKMIADLGHQLGALAKADEEARDDISKECLVLAERIIAAAGEPEKAGD